MTRDTLHCGVTSDTLLKKKAYASFIEPFEDRKEQVRDFLSRVAPNITVEFFELMDPVGIAGELAELKACILTKETAKGGEMINAARQEKGMIPLQLVYADMILTEDPASPKDG